MYLSRLLLNPIDREVQRDLADCQELHRTLLHAFPPLTNGNQPREYYGVLHRVDVQPRTGIPMVLVQSRVKPDWAFLAERSGYLLEDTDERNPDHKPLESVYAQLHDGQVLAFRLRANPTRKVETKSGPDGKRRNGRREPLRTQEEQIDWLRRKGDRGGFEVLSVRASVDVPDIRVLPEVAHRVVHGNKKERGMTFTSLVFEGRLRITDPGLFRETLDNGIGSAKAYGFGLLSIRKP